MAKKKFTLEDMLVPMDEIPYEVPENWCWVKLGSVSEIVTGNTPAKKNIEYYGEYLPFVKPADLDQGRNLTFSTEYLSEVGSEKARIIPKNSTAVCCIGSIGKSAYLEVDVATNQQINCVIPKGINSLYLYYYILSEEFQRQLWENSSATTISIINKSKMGNLNICIPPLAEQERIVNRIESLFDKVDRAAELVDEARDGFEKRRAAILEMAFSGELTKKWREENGVSDVQLLLDEISEEKEKLIREKIIKRSKVNLEIQSIQKRIPSEWKLASLNELAFVTKLAGFEYTKYIKNAIKEEGEVPLVRAQNVKGGKLEVNNLQYIDKEVSLGLERSALCKKSVLMTFIGAGIGDVALFDTDKRYHLAPNVAKIELFNNYGKHMEEKYVLYYLMSLEGRKEIFKSMKATAQPSLSMETIREIVVPVPSIEEQQHIVKLLETLINKEYDIDELTRINEQSEFIKKSILAKAFRGELGSNDLNEESSIELLKELIK